MDINDFRGVTTIIVFIAFISVCAWAYSSKRKKSFDEAANLPFVDDDDNEDKKNINSQQEKHRDE